MRREISYIIARPSTLANLCIHLLLLNNIIQFEFGSEFDNRSSSISNNYDNSCNNNEKIWMEAGYRDNF